MRRVLVVTLFNAVSGTCVLGEWKMNEEQESLRVYQAHAKRHEQAYLSFTQVYELENPKPKAPAIHAGLPWLMLPFLVIAVSGIALSALRTAPIFASIARPIVGEQMANWEAALAVIVIEFTMVVLRYVMVIQSVQDGKELHLARWMQAGFWLAFGVAVVANIYSSVVHLEALKNITAVMDVVVALIVGVSAPVLAFISGDVLASLYARAELVRKRMSGEHRELLAVWSDTKERRWSARQSSYGVKIHVENASNSLSNSNSNGNFGMENARALPSRSILGHSKQPNASEIARTHFQINPSTLWDDSVDLVALAATLEIGKSTMYNVRTKMRTETPRSNDAS